MRISWITFAAPQRTPDGGLTSDTASLRYRVISPVLQMNRPPYRHRITPIGPSTSEAEREAALDADVLVFSKSFAPANEELARRAQAAGAAVIFDVCDNHYRHPQYGAHFRTMSALADQVVCNTEPMAEAARAYARGEPIVIEDPYEGPRGAPAFAPGERLELLWFGHPLNLDSLQAALADVTEFASRRPLRLTVLTRPTPQLTQAVQAISAEHAPHFAMTLKPWSLDAQWRELAACDTVVIPTLKNEQKDVKSANRMVEALWAGKPVAAQPLPAYLPFADWTPVRPTISEGVEWLCESRARVPGLVAEAQAYIAETFDPVRLGRRWEEVIRAQIGRRTTA
jgi:hypothetical protein